ncbi:RNA polymerase II transcription factor SIII (Elongin) subunit A [Fusarium albosuccineum]|uniref:RNA polymerase II transcription factor SIII (Elongin) subunit A n=1 Tax=Fusarium albosuccineum TaxID=1237068 RepID=A0A8H4L7T1_9HYPO|nr:RNA polymerase II transcription factor SIII (Elongin) subunit A [Fusarium albosuccineum]
MPVKSLMELASAACVKNIRELESVGDYLPYETVRSILLRVDSAHQLRQIELNSPQVEGETGEIWLKIIEREFPMEYKQKAYKPQNPKKWYRVWEKYKKDHDLALEESEKKLMNALAGLRQDKEKNTSKIVDRKLLPRAGRVGPRRPWGQRDGAGSTLAFTRGSRTKTHNGASVMRKVRRETKEIASIHGKLSRQGSASLSKLAKAPPAMVNDYRRASQPVFRPTQRVSEPSEVVTAHEERATFISDSESDQGEDLFDDDDDDNEPYGDDDEEELPPPRNPAPRSNSKASATSLLKKRPGSSSSAPSSAPSRPASTPRRSGILSNSYKGPRPQTTTTSSAAAPPKSSRPAEPPKPSQRLPRTQTSPPPSADPGPSSSPPPPAPSARPPVAVPARKRKAVDVFMKRKKRA